MRFYQFVLSAILLVSKSFSGSVEDGFELCGKVTSNNELIRALDNLNEAVFRICDDYAFTKKGVARFPQQCAEAISYLESRKTVEQVRTEIDRLVAVQTEQIELLIMTNKHLVNQSDPRDGSTPLMHAARGGHRDLIVLLIANGARTTATDIQGRTALQCAQFNSDLSSSSILVPYLSKPVVNECVRLIMAQENKSEVHTIQMKKNSRVRDLLCPMSGPDS